MFQIQHETDTIKLVFGTIKREPTGIIFETNIFNHLPESGTIKLEIVTNNLKLF